MAELNQKEVALTAERLRHLVSYDPVTGIMCWQNPTNRRILAGSEFGNINPRWGRRSGVIDGYRHFVHRLAWLYVHGRWPSGAIDHRNCDPLDNRLSNLREASRSQNNVNRRSPRPLGMRGAFRRRSGWEAHISINNKCVYIGNYRTPGEAHDAYVAKAREVYGEFARVD